MQADEIKAKVQGGYLWLAMAIMVRTRLWLGGVVSLRRDLALIQALANQIRAITLCRPLLLAVDGLPSYVRAFQRAFCTALSHPGKQGRPQLTDDTNFTDFHRFSGDLSVKIRRIRSIRVPILSSPTGC